MDSEVITLQQQRPAWTVVPFEIWTMIMSLMMSPTDILPMWRRYRLVCRTFKQAIEVAARIHLLPSLALQFVDLDNGAVTVNGVRSIVRARPPPLDFCGVSGDGGARGTFRLDRRRLQDSTAVCLKNPHWDPATHTLKLRSQAMEQVFQDFVVEQIRRSLQRLGQASTGVAPVPWDPPMAIHTYAFPLTQFAEIEVDLEALEISLPWKPLIGGMALEQMRIGKPLLEGALADVERDPWMTTGRVLSRKEQALKLAFTSVPCRRERFRRAFEVAVARREYIRDRDLRDWPPDIKHASAVALCASENQLIVYTAWNIMAFDLDNMWYDE